MGRAAAPMPALLGLVVVLRFSSLLALGPQVKKSIKRSEVNLVGELEDIQWIGAGKHTVFIQSDLGYIYRSVDDGNTWAQQNDALRQLTPGSKEAISIVQLINSEADDNYVWLRSKSGAFSYTSKNAGETWELSPLPAGAVYIGEVELHPKDKQRVLVTTIDGSCKTVESDYEQALSMCFRTLHLSEDFGKTWKQIRGDVVQARSFPFAAWKIGGKRAEQGAPLAKTKMLTRAKPWGAADGILATVHSNKNDDTKYGIWDAEVNFVLSNDGFKTEEVLVAGGNRFVFSQRYMFVAQVIPGSTNGEVSLQISTRGAGGTLLAFHRVSLPFKIKQHEYTVLDTSEDAIFLHVNHKGIGGSSSYGHVYISDSMGANFSLSLPHNVRNPSGQCDFDKMVGLEGIYMANYVNNAEWIERWEETGSSDMNQEARGNGKTGKNGRKPIPRVRTVITFDKGGLWKYLTAPKVDASGKPIECSNAGKNKHCSLHLHGATDTFGPFYSSEVATGIILATGNVGPFLSNNAKDVNTYMSRDAGLTWKEVRTGSRIYEIGDHGGVIVMADDYGDTDVLEFSVDEGASWRSVTFTNQKMRVDNIIIEPSGRGRKFIVYGKRTDISTGDVYGVAVYFDFSSFHQRECIGVELAGQGSSDFELWSPSDDRMGGRCLLGHSVTYTRRRPTALCYHSATHDRVSTATNCPCTEQDYECDYGYMRKEFGAQCVRDDTVNDLTAMAAAAAANCQPGGTYTLSNGYRKVTGDTCTVQGGLDRMPTVYPCHKGFLGVTHTGLLVLLLIVGLAFGLGFVTYRSKRDHRSNPFGAFGGGIAAQHFGSGSEGVIASLRKALFGGNRFTYAEVGSSVAEPETAADYPEFDDDFDDGFDLEDEEDDRHAELLPAMTSAKPLGGPSLFEDATPVPRLNAPPTVSDSFDGDAV